MDGTHQHIKPLSARDMTLFTVSTILLPDAIDASMPVGEVAIRWAEVENRSRGAA